MTRKFDCPFVEVTCWIPIRWLEILHLLRENPQFQIALRDALKQMFYQREDSSNE